MIETFKDDLRRGEQIELKLLSVIQSKYPNAYKVEGYFKDYDLFVPEVNKSVEVKADEKSKYTGNILVEIEFNGKPSALSTTKADFWVWWDGYVFTWFTPNDIKKCIQDTNQQIRQFIGNGDTVPKKAYLIKKEILYNYSLKF
jgi:hypothetical protein